MKHFTLLPLLVLSFLYLGCDTRGEPPVPSAECRVAEHVPVVQAVPMAELCSVLEPGEDPAVVVSALVPYGLRRYTATFGYAQVTFVWWVSAEAQDGALADFCP